MSVSPAPPHDPTALRHAFASFATGVTVVTALAPDGQPVGLTVNSFSSVSLAPPLVQWCLQLASRLHPVFCAAGHFSVSVLQETQGPIALRFASPVADRFHGVELLQPPGEPPLIADALAHFHCRTHAMHRLGDHELLVGEVLRSTVNDSGAPLIFQGHRFQRLSTA